jgi:hypothetical protein
VEGGMIPEPQKTYLLELLTKLGPAADEFVLVGGQALKFVLEGARATKDFDFILDAVALREKPAHVGEKLAALGYAVVPESRNFQFQKPIPGTKETMRVEFMAPDEPKRGKDFRVTIEKGLHARECIGGAIALEQSDLHELQGSLPDGTPARADLRVTRGHALVLLKLLALHDRYKNIRGPEQAEHDRDEARVHASDIIAILNATLDPVAFREAFYGQFAADAGFGIRVSDHIRDYFQTDTSPGILLYEESLREGAPTDRATRSQLAAELERAFRMMATIVPSAAFSALRFAIDNLCNIEHNRGLAEDLLKGLASTGVALSSKQAIGFFPGEVFGGAFARGQVFEISAFEEMRKLDKGETILLAGYWRRQSAALLDDEAFKARYAKIMA